MKDEWRHMKTIRRYSLMSPLLRVVINHAAGIRLESDRGTKQLTVLGMVRNLL